MSRLRVLMCRIDERDDAQMTELAHVDVPPLRPEWGPACLAVLEAQVAEAGQRVLARLCELHWEDLDAQAVARYAAAQPPGTVVADGYAPLQVASRFGTLRLRRQVCAHRDGRPHVLPGNRLLPTQRGLLITRGLQELACLLPQEIPSPRRRACWAGRWVNPGCSARPPCASWYAPTGSACGARNAPRRCNC